MREDIWIPSGTKIEQFCRDIGDFNHLHSIEWTKLHGKRPVVPGMLTFIHSLRGSLPSWTNNIQMVFSGMVSEGDHVSLCAPQHNDSDISLGAFVNEKNVLANGESYSRLSSSSDHYSASGPLRTYKIFPDAVSRFGRFIYEEDARDKVYLMAFASHALLDAVDHPRSELEIKLNSMLDSDDPKRAIAPVYEFIDFKLDDFQLSEEVDFMIEIRADENDKRRYSFFIECYSGGDVAYTALANLKAIPLKLIVKMMKNSE